MAVRRRGIYRHTVKIGDVTVGAGGGGDRLSRVKVVAVLGERRGESALEGGGGRR